MNIIEQNSEIIRFASSDNLHIITIDTDKLGLVLSHNDNWTVSVNKKYGYIMTPVARSNKYVWALEKLALSRIILGYERTFLHLDVDHIDRNRLNNRVSNLRLIPHNKNCINTVKNLPNKSSKYRGVTWKKDKSKWEAKIRSDSSTRIFLGYWNTEEEAASAYNRAAIKYHGAFAMLNQIPS